MTSLLIYINHLNGGGAEKVLCDIVANIDKNKFEVTVMTKDNKGVYIESIKKHCKHRVIFNDMTSSDRMFGKIKNIIYINIREYIFNNFPSIIYKRFIKERYDIEIAFLEGQSTRLIGSSTNKSSKKLAWVHTDVIKNQWADKYYRSLKEQRNCYRKFDKIICVSNDSKKSFCKKFNLEQNILVQNNPLDERKIKLKSNEEVELIISRNKFRLIAIGRLVEEKGFDRLLKVHKKLIEEKFNIELIILGDGYLRTFYEEYINTNMLKDSVKLLGFQDNPYKYISKAQCFICSSRVEGYPLVLVESLIIGLPIVSTNCTGPREILDNGKYGLLVENNLDGLYKGIKNIIQNSELRDYYKNVAIERGKLFSIDESMKNIEKIIST